MEAFRHFGFLFNSGHSRDPHPYRTTLWRGGHDISDQALMPDQTLSLAIPAQMLPQYLGLHR